MKEGAEQWGRWNRLLKSHGIADPPLGLLGHLGIARMAWSLCRAGQDFLLLPRRISLQMRVRHKSYELSIAVLHAGTKKFYLSDE